METSLKNNREIGGIECFDCAIDLIGEEGRIMFNMVQTGCDSYAVLLIGNDELEGSRDDLSFCQLIFQTG
ncbi:MAG: hypothetical protein HC906_06000 [Bacteroidales bacterium]|nr:hypothetical protein [Bacteroidales bacterium]